MFPDCWRGDGRCRTSFYLERSPMSLGTSLLAWSNRTRRLKGPNEQIEQDYILQTHDNVSKETIVAKKHLHYQRHEIRARVWALSFSSIKHKQSALDAILLTSMRSYLRTSKYNDWQQAKIQDDILKIVFLWRELEINLNIVLIFVDQSGFAKTCYCLVCMKSQNSMSTTRWTDRPICVLGSIF